MGPLMQAHYWWWLAALGLGILEMLSGTFYLVVLALGCAAGGLAAFAGWSLVMQIVATTVVTVLGWAVLHRWHPARGTRRSATTDRDVLLDIGERVTVAAWDEQGRADVQYRGARWQAELENNSRQPGAMPAPGEYEIRGIVGNRLQLARPA